MDKGNITTCASAVVQGSSEIHNQESSITHPTASSSYTYNGVLKFEENFWGEENDGFDVLNNKLGNSLDSLKQTILYASTRQSIEEEYSKNLAKASTSTSLGKIETGTLKQALEKWSSLSEAIARTHQQFSIKLQEEFVLPLTDCRKAQKKLRKYYESEMEKIMKQTKNEKSNCERLARLHQDRYAAFCLAAEKASRIPAEATRKEQEKIIEKSLKTKYDFEKTEEEYKHAIERYNTCLDMRDAKMREVCQSYQAMEEERLAEIKRTLQKVMDLQLELLGNFNLKVYMKMQECIDGINVQDDLNAFVRTCGTGQARQKRWKMEQLLEQSSKAVDETIMNNLLYPNDSSANNNRMTLKRRSSVFGKKATMFMDKFFHQSTTAGTGNPNPGPISGTLREPVVQVRRKLSTLFTSNPYSNPNNVVNANNAAVSNVESTSPPQPVSHKTATNPETISPTRKPRNLEWMSKFAVADDQTFDTVATAAPKQPSDISHVQKSPSHKNGSVKFTDNQNNNISAAVADEIASEVHGNGKPLEKDNSLSTLSSSKEKDENEDHHTVEQDTEVEPTEPIVITNNHKDSDIASKFKQNMIISEKPQYKETPLVAAAKISMQVPAKPELSNMTNVIPTMPVTSKKDFTFTRRSIKMEGWIEVKEDSLSQIRRWAALEGGYIWFFESKEDNNKPQGANKPKSMVSVTRAEITESVDDDNRTCINVVSNRKHVQLAIIDPEEYSMWLSVLKSSTKLGK